MWNFPWYIALNSEKTPVKSSSSFALVLQNQWNLMACLNFKSYETINFSFNINRRSKISTIILPPTFMFENHMLFSCICLIYQACLNPMYKHSKTPHAFSPNCCIVNPKIVNTSLCELPPFVNPFLWVVLVLCRPPFRLRTSVILLKNSTYHSSKTEDSTSLFDLDCQHQSDLLYNLKQ